MQATLGLNLVKFGFNLFKFGCDRKHSGLGPNLNKIEK